jgi:bridging integrator 3
MCAYFPVVNEHITKRNKKVRLLLEQNISVSMILPQLLDYDAARSRMRKLIDKPSEDPTKLPKVVSNTIFYTCKCY